MTGFMNGGGAAHGQNFVNEDRIAHKARNSSSSSSERLFYTVSSSMNEVIFAHSQGHDQTLFGPVEGDGTAELGGHGSVYQFTSEALGWDGRHDRRAATFCPLDGYFIIISLA